MTTINIDYDVSDDAVKRVRAALDDVAKRDPNWNGAEFTIARNDFTSIDSDDEIAGASLLHSVVFPAIRGE